MGRPKLLLPVEGETILRRLLAALDRPRIEATLLVVRRDDPALIAEARSAGERTIVVTPEVDPPDMRTSVEHALAEIAARFNPKPNDGWLLVPGDHPVLSGDVVERLIAAWDASEASILLPVHAGRRGHPTFLRWSLAAEVAAIPPDRGLNHLVAAHADDLAEIPIDDPAVVTDLDTPEDYERIVGSG
jgi:molybdenum cofactor cytidylyltransferase